MKAPTIIFQFVAVGVLLGFAGPVTASVDPNIPKILLHVRSVLTKNPCALTPLSDNCANAITKGGLYPVNTAYHVLVVIDRGNALTSADGIAGVQFGVDYHGNYDPYGGGTLINIFGWTLCGILEFSSPTWPRSGQGNLITWDPINTCQRGRLACAGYFYMNAYSQSTLFLVKRQSDNQAKVADCSAREYSLPDGALGFAAFSAGAAVNGCNPCLIDCHAPVSVEDATWSKVKTLLD